MLPSLYFEEAYISGMSASLVLSLPPKLKYGIIACRDNHFNRLLPLANKLMPLG